jgi:hypothetical protein
MRTLGSWRASNCEVSLVSTSPWPLQTISGQMQLRCSTMAMALEVTGVKSRIL